MYSIFVLRICRRRALYILTVSQPLSTDAASDTDKRHSTALQKVHHHHHPFIHPSKNDKQSPSLSLSPSLSTSQKRRQRTHISKTKQNTTQATLHAGRSVVLVFRINHFVESLRLFLIWELFMRYYILSTFKIIYRIL